MDRPNSEPARDPAVLLQKARSGDRAALGRLLSVAERGGVPGRRLAQLCRVPDTQAAHVVGITGPPGAGKSSLTNRLIRHARDEGQKVAVLAVDPSSPYSGGAILGDRIRMQGHALDPEVFIRSLASRGQQGGLALAVPDSIRTLLAAGWPLVLLETVGVGQVELDVAGTADTTVVVVTPGWGDSVQVAKAGLLEIADVFVVNKADQPGATQTCRDLEAMLDLGTRERQWRPPVLSCSAASGKGVDSLWQTVSQHRLYLEQTGELQTRRQRRAEEQLARVLQEMVLKRFMAGSQAEAWQRVASGLAQGLLDPYSAAEQLLEGVESPGPTR